MTVADAHMERLLAELGERARAEIQRVRAEAGARVEARRAQCDALVGMRAADAIAVVDAEFARRRAAVVANARQRARAALLTAQHALVERVIERTRQLTTARLGEPAGSAALERRAVMLRRYAVTTDVVVRASGTGISVVADHGHLTIDDTVDAWLAADREAIAMDVCRAVETAPC